MYVERNIKALLRSHCCHGKAVSITRVSSFSYPGCNVYSPYYIAVCVLSDSNIFVHILS